MERLKRGNYRSDIDRYFWSYRSNNVEYWITKERFDILTQKEHDRNHKKYLENKSYAYEKTKLRQKNLPHTSIKEEYPYTKGDIKNGLYFYRYSTYTDKNRKRKEIWLSKEKYDYKTHQNKQLNKNYLSKKENRDKIENRKLTHWHHYLYASCRSSSIYRNNTHENEISPEWILEKFNEQKGMCYWLNIPLKITKEYKHLLKPSLDRLDPNIGYTKENTVITSLYANFGRGDRSEEDTRTFIKFLKSSIKNEENKY